MSAGLLSLSHGVYNDWAMRTTLPLSIMLTISITQLILSTSLKTVVSRATVRSCLYFRLSRP